MTNELTGWIQTATEAVKQMQQWPVAILIVATLIVMGGVLKSLEYFPNRMIPLMVLVLGAALNTMLGDTGSIAPTQRNPMAVLAMQGILLGFAAWALHALLLRRLERYIPFLAGKSGDTVQIKKEDIQ